MKKNILSSKSESLNIKSQAKSIWSGTFSDSPEYVNYYFKYRFKIENFFFLSNPSNLIISSFHLNPYDLIFSNFKYKGRYLVAAATAPEYRNLGLFRELFFSSLLNLYSSIDIIYLHPAISNFYEKFAFAPTHFLNKLKLTSDDVRNILKLQKNIPFYRNKNYLFPEFYKNFRDNNSLTLGGSFLHKSNFDIKEYFNEILLENGDIIYFESSNNASCEFSPIYKVFFSYTQSYNSICVKDVILETPCHKLNNNMELSKNIILSIASYFKDIKDNFSLIINLPENSIFNSYFDILSLFLDKQVVSKELYLLTRVVNLESFGLKFFNARLRNFEKNPDFQLLFIAVSDKHIEKNNIVFFLDFNNKNITTKFITSDGFIPTESSKGIFISIDTFTSIVINSETLTFINLKKEIEFFNFFNPIFLNKLFNIPSGYIYQDV